jgi:hypothetical protein
MSVRHGFGALGDSAMQAEGSRHTEESIEAIRRQIQSEIMGKMKDDRSSGAVARAKAEAEAKAKCAPPCCNSTKNEVC